LGVAPCRRNFPSEPEFKKKAFEIFCIFGTGFSVLGLRNVQPCIKKPSKKIASNDKIEKRSNLPVKNKGTLLARVA
jgi:hypothetical protein